MNEMRDEYIERLLLHINSVREYGRRLHIPEKQLQEHDSSKWNDIEFWPYAKYFVAKDRSHHACKMMARAWLHHIHHNQHHWQHWIFPDGYIIDGAHLENGVMAMPDIYALEMIADWHGAGYAYQDSWDISEWLENNMPNIIVHSQTANFLNNELAKLGYAKIVYNNNWGTI
jgi:hypothetical protein